MRRFATAFACLVTLSAAAPTMAQEAAYDVEGWHADAAQVREAMTTRYANLEWAQTVREADLGRAFAGADQRLSMLKSDREARELFDGFSRYLGDGHVRFEWPSGAPAETSTPSRPRPPCARVAGRKANVGKPIVATLPGYAAIETPGSALFPAGTLPLDGRKVGVVRIALFSADLEPKLCAEVLAEVNPKGGDCVDDCFNRLYYGVYGRLTLAFAEQLRAVKAAGAEVLIVDLTGNGGGSEWVEAAVRMVSGKRLKSSEVRVVRGDHWTKAYDRDIADIEAELRKAKSADRALLKSHLAELKTRRIDVATPCDGAPLTTGKPLGCDYLARGFHSSGPMASADPKALSGKSWASSLFNPVAFPYEEGVWSGPLVVAVDKDTASAAEQFTAIIQDNKAGVIVGSPTLGSGCGFTNGGAPVTLKHSGGILRLPDCARFRADGTNEVGGISPDVLAGFHANEGPRAHAARLGAVLPQAVRLATQVQ